MQSGSIYVSPSVVRLEIYPHELRISGYTATQTKILAHLLAQFVKELRTHKVRRDVINSAFEMAIKLMEAS